MPYFCHAVFTQCSLPLWRRQQERFHAVFTQLSRSFTKFPRSFSRSFTEKSTQFSRSFTKHALELLWDYVVWGIRDIGEKEFDTPTVYVGGMSPVWQHIRFGDCTVQFAGLESSCCGMPVHGGLYWSVQGSNAHLQCLRGGFHVPQFGMKRIWKPIATRPWQMLKQHLEIKNQEN